ncbi:hypothetical protein PR202_gb10448 [Eleusine coracana subsp. coracana]|uniref:Uncharacterized protein n=1 Tax=Eleusine coracana subsp. coracana TaxID=191504 RepID=A0AAV5EJB0_ELECO|nr:hypothetical protein PR202_gb10448 [Eleusine coracana subsp. coracana]
MSFSMPGGEPVAGKRHSRFEVSDHDKSQLMSTIHGYYKVALDRLPLPLIQHVHEAGLCVGFLDPVSNILANTILSRASPDEKVVNQEEQRWRAKKRSSLDEKEVNQEELRRRGKKRMRSQPGDASKEEGMEEESEEKGIEEESEEKDTEEELDKDALLREIEMCMISTDDASSIAARSLRGLTTFLTSYYRYLQTWEALFYLVQSRSDLLSAVCLIEQRRHTYAFSIHHPTTKVALACAALAAMHPQPEIFVSNTLAMRSRLVEAWEEGVHGGNLAEHTCLALGVMHPQPGMFVSNTLTLPFHTVEGVCKANLAELMSHVYHWLNGQITRHPVGFDHELSMMMVLLDKIHGFYLEAISRIPTALLRSRLNWALLKAGYCYGPFDPVANILINTIWYDTASPSHLEFEVDMIRMESLANIEFRSLNGLVAFMSAQFPTISTLDALLILLQENANLGAAVYRLKNEGLNPSIPDSHAYKIAASKARHPNPFVLADLSAGSMLVPEALKLAKSVTVLSPGDVQGDDYELHTICGVNTNIPKDGQFGYFLNKDGYPFSHINVWVRRRGEHPADAAHTLLFIECSNDCEGMKDTSFLCTLVSGSSKDSVCLALGLLSLVRVLRKAAWASQPSQACLVGDLAKSARARQQSQPQALKNERLRLLPGVLKQTGPAG